MKISYKAGFLSAAMMVSVLAFGADAHANNTSGSQRGYYSGRANASANIIPASELPINRGVGRGSNKGMLDLNRGYGNARVTDDYAGYTYPSDRDRYYGAMPASGSTSWNSERRQPGWRNMPAAQQNRAYRAPSSTRGNMSGNVNSEVYTNPAIGQGSNRANSGLDNETR